MAACSIRAISPASNSTRFSFYYVEYQIDIFELVSSTGHSNIDQRATENYHLSYAKSRTTLESSLADGGGVETGERLASLKGQYRAEGVGRGVEGGEIRKVGALVM